MQKTIMAIGAHADDVELHFGGTLFKYMDRGYAVVYVMSTNNMSGSIRTLQPDGSWKKVEALDSVATMDYRKRETAAAAKLFRADPIHLDHPQRKCYMAGPGGSVRFVELRYGCPLPEGVPGDVPTILTAFADKTAVDRLSQLILNRDPEVILTHGYAEVNPEHHATFLLAVKACQRAAREGYRGCLLASARSFNELGRLAGCWETWVDITGFVDRKLEAALKHESQYPAGFAHGMAHWRELAERRGALCGAGAIEAFNFVTPDPQSGRETEVLNELLSHRAGTAPWGWAASADARPADS